MLPLSWYRDNSLEYHDDSLQLPYQWARYVIVGELKNNLKADKIINLYPILSVDFMTFLWFLGTDLPCFAFIKFTFCCFFSKSQNRNYIFFPSQHIFDTKPSLHFKIYIKNLLSSLIPAINITVGKLEEVVPDNFLCCQSLHFYGKKFEEPSWIYEFNRKLKLAKYSLVSKEIMENNVKN